MIKKTALILILTLGWMGNIHPYDDFQSNGRLYTGHTIQSNAQKLPPEQQEYLSLLYLGLQGAEELLKERDPGTFQWKEFEDQLVIPFKLGLMIFINKHKLHRPPSPQN